MTKSDSSQRSLSVYVSFIYYNSSKPIIKLVVRSSYKYIFHCLSIILASLSLSQRGSEQKALIIDSHNSPAIESHHETPPGTLPTLVLDKYTGLERERDGGNKGRKIERRKTEGGREGTEGERVREGRLRQGGNRGRVMEV